MVIGSSTFADASLGGNGGDGVGVGGSGAMVISDLMSRASQTTTQSRENQMHTDDGASGI